MCSSKDADDNLTPPADDVLQAQHRRLVWVLLSTLGIVVATGTWWLFRDPQPWVVEARGLLEQALVQPRSAQALRLCRQAESLLDRYLVSAGRRKMSARVLLWAAQGLQGKPLTGGDRLGPFDPTACDTDDLTTAAAGLSQSGHLDLADWCLAEASRRPDRGVETLRWAGRIRQELGLDLQALEHYRDLVELAPTDAEAWLKIAQIHERRSEWAAILEPLRRYIALHPPASEYYRIHLVGYLIKVRQVSEARHEFDQLRAENPALVRREGLMEARLLQVEGQAEEALLVLGERGPRAGDDVSAARELEGRILLSLSRYAAAATALQAAVQAEPTNEDAYFSLGTAYARLGDKEQATACLDTHKRLRQLKKDIYQLERAAGQEPANVEVRLKLVRLCGDLGWTDLQQQWLRAAEVARTYKP
ncbi:MAG: tetratricopeptide repeat protein [Planctomycetota bacterium]|nr:tetratricopeptide repeat protein [Planctomycetota bacterium]